MTLIWAIKSSAQATLKEKTQPAILRMISSLDAQISDQKPSSNIWHFFDRFMYAISDLAPATCA